MKKYFLSTPRQLTNQEKKPFESSRDPRGRTRARTERVIMESPTVWLRPCIFFSWWIMMVRSILPLAEREKGGGDGFSCDVKSETANYVLYAHGRYSPQWRSTSKTGAPLQKHPKVLILSRRSSGLCSVVQEGVTVTVAPRRCRSGSFVGAWRGNTAGHLQPGVFGR